MTSRAELYAAPVFRVAGALRTVFGGIAVGGGVAAVATGGADWSAIPLLAGAAGALVAQLVIGMLGYRRAFDHDWPQVEPVTDDDDW